MPAHKHAKLMAEYAKDALETETPWLRWQHKGGDRAPVAWTQCQTHPGWYPSSEYIRKPATITINGIELPAPYRGPMLIDQEYWLSGSQIPYIWFGDAIDLHLMHIGLVHLTKEAAEQWSDALKKITS